MARGPQTINTAAAWIRQHQQVSESALAVTFAEVQETRWRYNTDEGYWLQWVGTHWARRQTPELLNEVRNFLTSFTKVLKRAEIVTQAEAVKYQSQRAVAAVEKLCRALPSFMARTVLFDTDPFLLGTPAGTVDLRNGKMQPANPADHITVLTPVAPAPEGTPPGPRWAAFLDAITSSDADFQKTLQQVAGVCAEGTSRDQKILFLYGSGGNGKGVFTRTVATLLGEHAVNAPRDLLMLQKNSQHPTALVDVTAARMAMATEVDDDAVWDTALIKDLTGGDPISVRRMRQDFYRTTARCFIIISGNRKPALKGVDDAIKRRFLVATFKLQVAADKVIPDLEKEFIKAEGPAILRWIIDGAVQREAEGRLHVAKVILEDTVDYFAEENVLQDFIGTYLVTQPVGETPVWMAKTAEIYDLWKGYCKDSGRHCGARNSFTTAMQTAGVKYHRANNGRYFLNIRKKTEAEVIAEAQEAAQGAAVSQ